jgi:hypothetical protein
MDRLKSVVSAIFLPVNKRVVKKNFELING